MTIKRELGEIQGIKEVQGDATTKKITVQWDLPATLKKITSTLEEINYPATD
jgi:copper chaperone CopZ